MSFFSKLLFNFNLSGFRSTRDDFYEQVSRSYENKESFREFLDAELKISMNPKTKNSSRAFALKVIRNRLAGGDQSKYSQLFATVMPIEDKMMLSALDDSSDKAALLREIAHMIREQRMLISIVYKKIIPPLLILPGAFAFCYVMATKSLPIAIKIAPPEVWTTFNMMVRRFAEYVASYGFITVAVVAGLVAFFFYQLPLWTGRLRNKLEQVKPSTAALLFPIAPFILPLSIYRDVRAGIMFSALSVMLQSGRTLNEALIEIRNTSQPWMRAHIRKILAHLDVHTTEYANAFSKGLVSPQLLARLSSSIRTEPRFDKVLIDLGKRGGNEVRAEVEKQTSKINTMLLMAGGLTVVFMMVGQQSISMSMTDEMSPAKMMLKRMKTQQEAPVNR